MEINLDTIRKIGVDAFVEALPPDQVEMFIHQLRRLEDAEKFGKFSTFFPDKGPLRRELYTKHLEFFKAGTSFRERCFMAGNRCISPWTYIETDQGPVPSADSWTSPRRDVVAWAEEDLCNAQAVSGYVAGIEPAFRLVLASGQFLDCSGEHRVLTVAGWASLAQIVSSSSGLRCWEGPEDYQASCAGDGYLGVRPLRSLGGIDLEPPPSGGDAQRPDLIFERSDEAEHRLRHIHGDPRGDRLSSRNDLRRFAGLFGLFSGASSAQPSLRLRGNSQAALRLATGLALHLKALASRRGRVGSYSPEAGQILFHGGSYMPPTPRPATQGPERFLDVTGPGSQVHELHYHAGRRAIFYPFWHIPLVGGQKIVAIVPIGFQPIIDAQVPGLNNYLSAGVINHNCGKTIAGAYEVTCHLTGEYPHWWEGRRFNAPVRVWAAGKTNETTRDIIQQELLGNITFSGQRKLVDGAGLIPRDLLSQEPGHLSWKAGVADLVDTIKVQHKTGGWSELGLKSYQQGRGSFEGTARHVIWFDEEPPLDVYGEALIRTATTRGVILLTFTPLEGMSDVVQSFLPREMRPGGGE